MRRPIGFWKTHSGAVCSGQFFVPTILTRMSYYFTEDPGFNPACMNQVNVDNTAIGSFQNAQYTGQVTPAGTKITLTLSIDGTYNYMASVSLGGTTYLTSAGSIQVTVTPNMPITLNFSINPVGPGGVPGGEYHLHAICSF